MNRSPRVFRLNLRPVPDGRYGATLTVSTNDVTDVVARLGEERIERLRPALLAAVTASKHARTVLSPTRRAPIPLIEDAGVRLTLTALATAPLRKAGRADAVRRGVDKMTSEEAHYWYALCTGHNRRRALRALRTLLAEE